MGLRFELWVVFFFLTGIVGVILCDPQGKPLCNAFYYPLLMIFLIPWLVYIFPTLSSVPKRLVLWQGLSILLHLGPVHCSVQLKFFFLLLSSY